MNHDELDLDLERRLRRIAEAPQPPVPASVYRQAVAVAEERERGMGTYVSLRRFTRRGYSLGMAVAGLAAAVAIAIGAFGVISSIRNGTPVGQTGASSVSASPAATSSATVAPSPVTTPTPVASATPKTLTIGVPESAPAAVTVAGADPAAAWTAITFAPTPLVNTMPGLHAERWRGGWVEQGWGPQDAEHGWAWVSSDGASWHPIGVLGTVHASAAGLTSFDSSFTKAWTSPDGVHWTEHAITGLAGRQVFGMTATDVGIVAPSYTKDVPAQFAGAIFSSDGVAWQDLTPALESALLGGTVAEFQVVRTDDLFVALVNKQQGTKETQVVLHSGDGRTWDRSDPGIIDGCPRLSGMLAAGGGVLAWCDENPNVWLSTVDGITWQTQQALGPIGHAPRLGDETYLVSNGLRIVVQAGDGRLWTSLDARTWTKLAGSAPVEYGGDYVGRKVQLGPRGIMWNEQYGAAR